MKPKNKQTKFPVVRILCHRACHRQLNVISKARIKKIMQKDEEVGKVAQATPIIICQSLLNFSVVTSALTSSPDIFMSMSRK
jgi:hypothetical protein